MNRRQRLTLSKRLAGSLQKALPMRQMRNMLNQQLFSGVSNYAINLDDNDEAYIEDGYEINPDVYAVINGITNAASAVPPIVYRVTNQTQARKYYRLKYAQRNGAQEKFVGKAEELKEQAFEEVPDSDLAQVIDRPNPLQAWPEFVENIIGFKLITGNSYVHGVELTDGRFGELWPMPPQLTRIKASKSTETLIEGYQLISYGTSQDIPPETVMHLKYWNPDYSYQGSHLYGMSPLKAARRSIRSGNDGKTALSRAFANNGAMGMVFPDDPEITSLDPKQRQQIQRFFDQKGARPENYKKVLATSARMGWVPFGMPPVDLEIIEAGKMSMRDICNVYSFPSELLNDPDNKTNTNKKESRKQLYQEVVIPTLERFYSELNRWMVPRFESDGVDYHIDYDVTQIEALQEDVGEKVDWLAAAWWIPPNQKAKEMGFDPVDDPLFDEPWVSMNMLPVSLSVGDLGFTEEEQKLLKLEYMNGN